MTDFLKRLPRALVIIAFLGSIEGCNSDQVVLLPSADGSKSSLILKNKNGEKVIDQPYQTGSVNLMGSLSIREEKPDTVRTRYGEALKAQPKRPTSYTVYFVIGQDTITQESLAVVEEVKADLKTRHAPEIVVIGHTDRVGGLKENDELSLKRANVMRDILIENGVTAENIATAGRGERELLIPTGDEVPEPKNRRVEISVQ